LGLPGHNIIQRKTSSPITRIEKAPFFSVKDYFATIVPPDKRVYIEFANSHTLNRLDVSSVDSATERGIGPPFTHWNLSTTSPQVDSILSALHWTQDTLTHLKHKLDLAFCISICNREPCEIGFQRSGTGMYVYQIFSKPIPDSLKAAYNNGCSDIIYNPTGRYAFRRTEFATKNPGSVSQRCL